MKIISSFFLIICLTAASPASLLAHGGGHEAKPQKTDSSPATHPEETLLPEETFGEETVGLEDLPGMGAGESGEVDYGLGKSPAPEETVNEMGQDPLWGQDHEMTQDTAPPMDLSHMSKHGMAEMDLVEPAGHKLVSTSQKGYGWSLALTLLSAMMFGFLSWKKPCE